MMRNTCSETNPDGGWEGGDLVCDGIRWRDTANLIVALHNKNLKPK
jgi:hypothetical protein